MYATERAQAQEPEAARGAAARRLLHWYLDTAEAAAHTVSPFRYRLAREPVAADFPPLDFGSVDEALAWCDDERANFAAATRQAAATGLLDIAWRLPPTLSPLFTRRSYWADCVTLNRLAADGAHKVGDRLGEAWALNQLGFALARLGDPEAFGHLEQALAIRQEFGDTQGEAQTALALGEGYLNIHGPGEDALRYNRRAADVLEPMGATSLRSVALNNLGEVLFQLGDLDAAVDCYRQARDISREVGGHVEGHALHNLGLVLLRAHRIDEAVASFSEALSKHRAWGVLVGEAVTLRHLGEAQAEAGSTAEARASLTDAIGIYEQIGNQAEAAATATLLASLTAV
jgi:tetratricopeptide (TPR) repeat protein